MKRAVGVVGLGAMGGAMARSLRRAGFAVRGADPRPAARAELRDAGGAAFESAAELGECGEIVVMTATAAQAEAALFAADGRLRAGAGALVMLCLTMPPPRARALCAKIAAGGCEPLDAPVTGGASGAAAGRLIFMASGGDSAIERAKPLTDAMGEKVLRFGDSPGAGSTAKMVNQIVAGCNWAAAAEAMAFGARAGLSPDALFALLRGGAAASWMLEDRGPRMLDRAFSPPKSAIDIFVKDLDIALAGGRDLGFALPLAAEARRIYAAAAAAGFARLDDSALADFCERENARPPAASV